MCGLRERVAQLARAVVVARERDAPARASGSSSSRTRAYSAGSPCSVRSPETRTASGAEAELPTWATTRARSPSGVAGGGADVRVGELEDHPASSSANARRTLRGARPVTTSRVSRRRASCRSRARRAPRACAAARAARTGTAQDRDGEGPRRPARVAEDEPAGLLARRARSGRGAAPARCGAGPRPWRRVGATSQLPLVRERADADPARLAQRRRRRDARARRAGRSRRSVGELARACGRPARRVQRSSSSSMVIRPAVGVVAEEVDGMVALGVGGTEVRASCSCRKASEVTPALSPL